MRKLISEVTERLVKINGVNYKIVMEKSVQYSWATVRVWRWNGHVWEFRHEFEWGNGQLV